MTKTFLQLLAHCELRFLLFICDAFSMFTSPPRALQTRYSETKNNAMEVFCSEEKRGSGDLEETELSVRNTKILPKKYVHNIVLQVIVGYCPNSVLSGSHLCT